MATGSAVMFSLFACLMMAMPFYAASAGGVVVRGRNPIGVAQGSLPSYKEGDSTIFTCDPPCANGHCCLLKPGAVSPRCQSVLLSGSPCFWSHYSLSMPSNSEAIFGSACPCMVGMFCTKAGSSQQFLGGSCSWA